MRSIFLLGIMGLVGAGQAESAGPVEESPPARHLALWRKCIADSGRLYEAGDFTAAEKLLEEGVRLAEQLPGLDVRLPRTIHALAFLYQEHGKYAEATPLYLRAIRLWERLGPVQHAALLQSTDNLISAYMETRNYQAARKLLEWRLPEMERAAAKWEDRAAYLNMQASMADAQRRYGEAETLYRQSLTLWEQNAEAGEKNTAFVLLNLSDVLAATKRYQEALDLTLRALAILEKLGPTERPWVVRALDHAASLEVKLGRPMDAEQYYDRGLTMAKLVLGAEHPFTGVIMLRYSMVLRTRRKAQAKVMAREAHAILNRRDASRWTVDVGDLALHTR